MNKLQSPCCNAEMNENDAWWVSTREFLPNDGEKVLIISKFGHISNAMYGGTGYGSRLFHPGGLKQNDDVKWWMPIPTDGWKDVKVEQPKDGEAALTMGYYGGIYNGVWKRPRGSNEYSFRPFVREVLYWREIPILPAGVHLSER